MTTSLIKRARFLTAGLCSGLLIAGMVRAGDAYAPPPMQVLIRTELPSVQPPFHRAFVTSETNKFAFLIPDGLQLHNDPLHGRINLSNVEGNRYISFTILDPTPSEGRQLSADVYREVVLNSFSNAKILEENSRVAAGRSGPAFDIQWTSAGIVQHTRVVFAATAAGVLEFTASTSPDKFSALENDFNQVLGTFCFSTNGKLEVPPVSDKL
jgi:hypothetical protein